MNTSRRQFIRQFSVLAGCYTVSAGLASCSAPGSSVKPGLSARYLFSQGIASADPQPDAVMLWTRIIDSDSGEPVSLAMELALDRDFAEVVSSQQMQASAESDHTLRCFVDGLEPDQWYYYRFLTPDGYASPLGRTRTAPAADRAAPLNLAVFSCQNYESGFFNAYRALMVEDEQAPPEQRIHLCLHVGDFIYENVNGAPFGRADPGRFHKNRDGSDRTAGLLPSGGRPGERGAQVLPQTLDDYRHIYKSYLSDPHIQAARAWYPFVYIWDDHEVLNDYWQGFHPNGALQTLKVMGNQAWFEYLPAMLTEAAPGPAGMNQARDFAPVEVADAAAGEFDEDYLSLEANTQAAVASMTIYRSLKWGQTADLLLLDGRSYRGPRGLDSAILGTGIVSYPEAPIDPNLVYLMNAGRTAHGGNPPASLEYEGRTIDNPRRDHPRASMLGRQQKDWLKQSLSKSTAAWKLLCNNVPMMRFGFDTRFREQGFPSAIYWTDSWDGYPVERNELMSYILEQQLSNVVSLTGDRHAHFAGLVLDDHDAEQPQPVAPELVGASISAQDRLAIQTNLFGDDEELLRRTICDGARIGYFKEQAPAMNAWLLHGEQAAAVLSETADLEQAAAAADPSINPHLRYADSDAYGYYLVRVRQNNMHAEFVTMPKPMAEEVEGAPVIRRRVSMDIPAWTAAEAPRIENISVAGEEPLLGIKEL